jgi:hypothetical protein
MIRTQFRERIGDTLLSASNPVAPWFNRAAIEALLASHLSGRRDNGKRLWALLILFTVAARRFHRTTARVRSIPRQAHLHDVQ